MLIGRKLAGNVLKILNICLQYELVLHWFFKQTLNRAVECKIKPEAKGNWVGNCQYVYIVSTVYENPQNGIIIYEYKTSSKANYPSTFTNLSEVLNISTIIPDYM